MASLTCENHRQLRWSCKDMAVSGGRYNACRSIFFVGMATGIPYGDGSGEDCDRYLYSKSGEKIGMLHECACPPKYLRAVAIDGKLLPAAPIFPKQKGE